MPDMNIHHPHYHFSVAMEVEELAKLCCLSENEAGKTLATLASAGICDINDLHHATREDFQNAGLSEELSNILYIEMRAQKRAHSRRSSVHHISGVLNESIRISRNDLSSPLVRRISRDATLPTDGTDMKDNCSLMEYDAIIEADTPVQAIQYIAVINHDFFLKTGGAVCPASPATNELTTEQKELFQSEQHQFIVKIKWALPMEGSYDVLTFLVDT